jgi:holo-[acyl-carrier protein] synthase
MKKIMKNTKILGLGIDILEIDRMEKAIKRHGQLFLDRLFSKKEQAYCCTFKKKSSIRFAARFCAKESVAKALGCGFGKQLQFLDIEITPDNKGKPIVFFSEKILQTFSNPQIHLSISHTSSTASAVAIWEG